MKLTSKFLSLLFLISTFFYAPPHIAAQTSAQTLTPLRTEAFNLTEDMEVGLEIEARAPGASWAREGAEAAALLISVDGAYQQDLLLWAGDEIYRYRVMLGRIARGKHKVSVTLNPLRSAAKTRRAEIKSLTPLPLAPARGTKTNPADEDQIALAYAPFLCARPNTIDHFTDLPMVMYYEILHTTGGEMLARYTVIFTNEDGGTQTAALLSRWGRGTDIEWVYEARFRDGKIIEETYQGVQHETKHFTGARAGGTHPLLAVASDNNNFSDLGCSAVRFAPLPVRARLETATRESVMDLFPQTYRVMTEELTREKRISETPTDINTIADPREYLYIEATSQQAGTAIAFDVRVAGQSKIFATDMGEPRLRIDRSGYFRTAVRLPKGIAPSAVESVTARCEARATAAGEKSCAHLKVARVLMLDQNYMPQTLPLEIQPESSLMPGETKTFKLVRR